MPRNPVNDLKASGALRTKISGTDGPADDFESVTVINPAGVIALVGNQGSARSRIYGDGTKWMPIQSAAPTTLTPGQFFIETVSGVDNWVFVDSFGVAQYVSGNPGGLDTQVQFNDGGTFGGDSGLTYDKTNDILSVGTAIRLGAGSAAIPAYSITGDTDTGVYSPGSDALGFATSGVLRLTIGTGSIISTVIGLFPAATINAASIRMPHGVVPLLPVDGDMWTTTAGVFAQINGGIVGPFNTGAGTIGGSIAVTQVAYGSGANAINGSATFVFDVVNSQLAIAPGTLSLPAYAFVGDLNTGIWSSGADTVNIAAGGVDMLVVDATTVTINGKLTVTGLIDPTGLALTPVAANPGGGLAASTIWVSSGDAQLYFGATLAGQGPFIVGSAGTPSIAFAGDANSGFYWVGSDDIGVSTGGVLRLDVSSTALTSTVIGIFPASTTSAASLRTPHGTAPTSPVNGDLWTTTAGMFAQINGSTVGPFSAGGGTITGSGVANQVVYWTGTSAIAGDTGMVYDATNNQLALALGSAAIPAYSFIGDLDTGIHSDTANEIDFDTAGVTRFYMHTTAVVSLLPLVLAAGTVGAPSLYFTGAATTGLYKVSSGVGVTVGGSQVLEILAATVTSAAVWRGPNGSVGTPALSFSGDTDTGIGQFAGADSLSFSIGGQHWYLFDLTKFQSYGQVQVNGSGGNTAPDYAFANDTDSGMYWAGTNSISFATSGTSRLNISTTAVTSSVIGIFPASTTAAASIRLPHGTAPTSPVDGDTWTTTAGFFAQINGSTVGPFGAGGGSITGTGVATRLTYWTGTSTVSSDAGLTYDATNNQLLIDPATNANPAYSFIGDLNTGIYNPAADTIGFTCNGGLTFSIAAGAIIAAIPITLPDGAAIAPALTFTNSGNTGFWLYTSNTLVMQANGTEVGEFTSTLARFTLPVQLPATGTASATVLHFNSAGTGIYGDGSSVSFGISTVNALTVVQTGLRVADGSTAAPGYTFLSDNDTGFCHNNGSGSITVVLDGNAYYQFNIASFYAYGQIQVDTSLHSAAVPDYSFAVDQDTGMFRVTANTLGFSTDSTQRLSISTTALTSTLIGIFPATTTGAASLRLPHGTAPSAPTNGDLWTTTAGAYAQINGVTVTLGMGVLDSLNVTQAPDTGSATRTVYIEPGAHTALTASAEYISFLMAGVTQEHSTGNISTQRYACISAPTYDFVGSSTITVAATFAVTGAPIQGTNCSITNSFALWVQAGITNLGGDLKLSLAGSGIYIKEGSNATMGVATMTGGSVVVSTTKVTANSRIFLTRQNNAGTVSVAADVTARTPGTDFTITAGVADTSDVAWLIVEPS